AGAAVDQDAVDGRIGDPARDDGAQLVDVVAGDGALVQAVAGFGECFDEEGAGAVLLQRPGIGYGQHAQRKRDELGSCAHAASVSSFSSSAWCSRVRRSISSSRSPSMTCGSAYRVRPSTRWSVIRPCGKL